MITINYAPYFLLEVTCFWVGGNLITRKTNSSDHLECRQEADSVPVTHRERIRFRLVCATLDVILKLSPYAFSQASGCRKGAGMCITFITKVTDTHIQIHL